MRKAAIISLLILALGATNLAAAADTKWAGVDETVVEKFATEAGHPPRKPFINTDQGDLLLFVFLIAGTIGGFIGGYCFRGLFPPKAKAPDQQSHD
jgi:ABC-type cobalt transport system substrate-binding protein